MFEHVTCVCGGPSLSAFVFTVGGDASRTLQALLCCGAVGFSAEAYYFLFVLSLDDRCESKLPTFSVLAFSGWPSIASCDSAPGIFVTSSTLLVPKSTFSRWKKDTNNAAPYRGMQCTLYGWRFGTRVHML